MLLGDEDTRYEVEIMLGSTDPSHIIRTIEYWDYEKKRYPRYNHVAVIIAEDITTRFLNVISLFNGVIPLIALQMNAIQYGDEINLNFVKILDHMDPGSDEENEAEPTDRKYWESKSNVLYFMDTIFKDVKEYAPEYDLKYNKFYIGLARDGVATNFIFFQPKKQFLYLLIRLPETEESSNILDEGEFDYDYNSRNRTYKVKFTRIKEYEDHKDQIMRLTKYAMEYKNLIVE